MKGRQQLVELVANQADLEQTFNPSDPEYVARLLKCRQCPSSLKVCILQSLAYFCEQVRHNLSSLTTSVGSPDIYLEVLKLLVEMSSFFGDMEKLERT